jgi:tRNA nucleotidyltransferase/poly(A) polymerase
MSSEKQYTGLGPFQDIFEFLRNQPDQPVYLVGGAVRDLLLQRPIRDLDFVLPAQYSRSLAHALTDHFSGECYTLDQKRNIFRVLLTRAEDAQLIIDFAAYRGVDIEADLRGRDFTFNAIGIDVKDLTRLVDPLQGAKALYDRKLILCSPSSLQDDPLRAVRAVRFAVNLQMRLDKTVIEEIRSVTPQLSQVSSERFRDELFHLLEMPKISTSIRLMDQLGILDTQLTFLSRLKELEQAPPHTMDVWGHTLSGVDNLEMLFDTLAIPFSEEKRKNGHLMMGMASLVLGRYRQRFIDHFSHPVSSGRNRKALLALGMLLHDAAKPDTHVQGPDGHNHFYSHDKVGENIAKAIGAQLSLSNDEVIFLTKIVGNHMLIHFMSREKQNPSTKTLHQFYRASGDTTIDMCFIGLADFLAKDVSGLVNADEWQRELEVTRFVLEAGWDRKEEILPEPLLSGGEIVRIWNIQPGPVIGKVLNELLEAQVGGVVVDIEQARDYISTRLSELKGQ